MILDVVYNHLGPEGNTLNEYGPYFTDRYQTPWGAAVKVDGPESDEVRKFIIDNALYWVTEYIWTDFGSTPFTGSLTSARDTSWMS